MKFFGFLLSLIAIPLGALICLAVLLGLTGSVYVAVTTGDYGAIGYLVIGYLFLGGMGLCILLVGRRWFRDFRQDTSNLPQPNSFVTQSGPPGITCKICDVGTLHRTKIHRLSGPSVAIGYLLLIPSVLGVLFALAMAIIPVLIAPNVQEMGKERLAIQKQEGLDAGIPIDLIETSAQGSITGADKLANLSESQRQLVHDLALAARVNSSSEELGSSVMVGTAFCFGLCCFVGGLLGWLLTMKKSVLQCSNCSAVVAAD